MLFLSSARSGPSSPSSSCVTWSPREDAACGRPVCVSGEDAAVCILSLSIVPRRLIGTGHGNIWSMEMCGCNLQVVSAVRCMKDLLACFDGVYTCRKSQRAYDAIKKKIADLA